MELLGTIVALTLVVGFYHPEWLPIVVAIEVLVGCLILFYRGVLLLPHRLYNDARHLEGKGHVLVSLRKVDLPTPWK